MAQPNIDFRSKLFDCYQKKDLCDVVLVAVDDGTRIEAHRLVLFVAAEFFNILLTIPMKERKMHEIELKAIDGETLRILVEYCYTGRIDINAENVNGLVSAATMYRFVELPAKCAEMYNRILDATNCFSICSIANQYNLEDLHIEATEFICAHFVDVMKEHEFLALKHDELLKLMKSEDIVVDTEDELLNGITKWIQFDVGGRKGLYKDLISNVNLLNLSKNDLPTYLISLRKNLDLVDGFLSVYELQNNGEQILNIKRKASSQNVLFAIGEANDGNHLSIERYCPKLNSWSDLQTTLDKRTNSAVACHDNADVYVIGGVENDSQSNEVRRISLKTLEFTQMTSMAYKRERAAAVVLDGYIYAIGGHSGFQLMNTVERFDVKANEWATMAPMNEIRCYHAAAVLSGKIYVVGGHKTDLRSTESYDPNRNAWTSLASLNLKRLRHGCCVVNGLLYAVGGEGDSGLLDSIERYDETINKWIMIEIRLGIPTRRSGFGITVLDNWVFIADDKKLEKIDLATGERIQLAPMHHRRTSFIHWSPL